MAPTATDRHGRITEILQAAIDLVPGERARFVTHDCLGDPDLEVEVNSLIEHHELVEEQQYFEHLSADIVACLSEPEPTDTTSGNTSLKVPRCLGRFDLIEMCGKGAFGTVYRAHDPKLDRTVAVKIPATEALTADARQRFLREAQSAARLRHPHIVQVHEAHVDEDSCYIVSDFIDGATLREGAKASSISYAEAAGLVAKLAGAIHYAHTMGIVHRDLKPENVMLASDGQPLITDFGLAKKEDDDSLKTHDGVLLGTPAYMSPEQAAGRGCKADSRSDQWSLGVILFELLVGRRPYEGTKSEILAGLSDELEPLGPRRWNKSIPVDLDTICLKCLAKNPARRYASCQQFASDLESWLRGEPILARPASIVERCWRWCQRNRLVAASLLMVIIIGLGAFAAVSAFWRDAARARDSADENFTWARQVITDITKQLIDDPQIRDRDEFRDVQMRLLESSVAFFEDFVSREADDPTLQAERGRAYWMLGVVHWLKHERQEALTAFAQTEAIYSSLSRRFPDNLDHRAGWAWSLGWQARVLHELGRPREASAPCNQAVAILEDIIQHDDQHAFTIVKLGACYLQRGILEDEEGETDRAAADYLLAVKTLQSDLTAEDPFLVGDRDYYLGLALQEHVEKLVQKNQLSAAVAVFLSIKQSKPDEPYQWYQLAIVHLAANDLDGYRRVCREMVEHFQNEIQPETADRILYTCVLQPDAIDNPRQLKSFADLTLPLWKGNYRLLGAAALRNGEYDDAIRHFDTAADAVPRRAWDWSFLAMAYHRAGQHDNARNALNKAIAWAASDGPADNWGWTEQVETQHLIQEAQSLIAASSE